MKKLKDRLGKLRDPFRLTQRKGFRIFGTAVLDIALVLLLMYFLLYRATKWTGGQVSWIPLGTYELLIDIFFWAAAALELAISPIRGLAALAVMFFKTAPGTTYPEQLYCEALIVPLAANLGSEKNNRRVWLGTHIVGFEFLFFLRLIGYAAPSYSDTKTIAFLTGTGTSFALVNANTLAVLLMSVLLLLWTYRKRKALTAFLWFLPAAVGVYLLTSSRTVLLVMVLFPFIAMVATRQKNVRTWKGICWAMLLMVAVLASVGISLWAINNYVLRIRIADDSFWARFEDFAAFMEKAPFLIARDIEIYDGRHWFDNLYYWLIHYMGILPAVVFITGYGCMNFILYRQRRLALLAISTTMLIFSIMENSMIYPFNFFVPLLAFARNEDSLPGAIPEAPDLPEPEAPAPGSS